MAVSSTVILSQYPGNDSTVVAYPTDFYFQDEEWIRVQVMDEDGVVTALALGDDFTVTGAGDPDGGEILTTEAWDSTHTLTIYRIVPFTQTLELEYNDRLPSALLERSLDKLTYMVQQLAGNTATGDRSLRFPFSEPTANETTLPTPVLRRDSLIYFNATTGELEVLPRLDLIEDITAALGDDSTDFASLTTGNTFAGTQTFEAAVTLDSTLAVTGTATHNGAVTFNKRVSFGLVTLTDAATVTWDASLGNLLTVTLAGDRTLANPTNLAPGTYILRVVQGTGGNHTLAFGSNYRFPAGAAPVLTIEEGGVDILTLINFSGTDVLVLASNDFQA